jgi:hypothetical protein
MLLQNKLNQALKSPVRAIRMRGSVRVLPFDHHEVEG